MAIFMVYDRDNAHVDPDKDARGCYKRGYIVQVFDDDQKLIEPPAAPFVFVKVPGMKKSEAEKYAMPEVETDAKGESVVVRRRAYKFGLDTLSSKAASVLSASRVVKDLSVDTFKVQTIVLKEGITVSAQESADALGKG